MENDDTADLPTPASREQGTAATHAPAPPRRRGGKWLFIIVLFAALGALAWWLWQQQQREQGSARADALTTRVDEVFRANEQLRRDLDALRTRLSESEAINRSVREELLGSTERSRALEDAVANIADQRLTGRDAMALNEAEYVLQLAGQRLSLFLDPAAAIAAYRLADSALAAAEDPLFGSVRQTIAAEIQALEASQPLQTQATLATLAALRTQVATLPARPNTARAANPDADANSPFARVFGQFVRISRDDSAGTLVARDSGLARSLAALDLRSAEAALFARDAAAFSAALAAARAEITAAFDADAAPVRAALAEVDRLSAQSMAPALPEVGSALRELRNLRTTRALSRDVVAPVQDEASP